jgi:UDP-N-acetylmuramoyl-tripeptide--D-alanyl-D-alanine ligase
MQARPLSFFAAACGGELRGGGSEAPVRRVCTDSRQAREGDLFVALRGERFDGHDFIAEVARKGVAGVVVERAKAPAAAPGCPLILVEDTRRALGRMAARYREDFTLPLIAVAGSNGKTTTKELLAAVLRERGSTLASEASFNNDIGVPLTLLRLETSHTAAVLEAGTNHPGELPALLGIIRPRYGVLTGIGREHLEFFGDLDGVAREEGSLAETLPSDGALFLHGDGDWTEAISRRAKCRVVTAGLGPRNDWRAEAIRVTDEGTVFRATSPRQEFSGEYRLRLLGRHQVPNALLVLAAAAELGVSSEQARRGLAACPPPRMRLNLRQAGGVRVLDDSYNANADSTQAALETLRELSCAGRRVAVLGDMAELGSHTVAAHEEAGRAAARAGVDLLVAVGRHAGATAAAARSAGLRDVIEFAEVPAAAAAVRTFARVGDLVLLKGSRAAGLERIGAALDVTAGRDGVKS